ncbi:polysaccharide pyruvyl transferase family protein [Microbacterium ureisolvens]|nr:polysaccharide pyruvyl transferase family protein [Microbacterium ureisolvens]
MVAGVLVGAYERDNFGDILFLEQTRHYLGGIESVACAPSSGDTSAVGGDAVEAYSAVFARSEIRFVWTVGGEAGATSVGDALRMSGGSLEPSSLGMITSSASPYLPRPTRHVATARVPAIVNSVGISGVATLHGARRLEAIASLREASFLSVRDRASAELLRSLSITHAVSPDLVQTLRLTADLRQNPSPDIAIVQAKAARIRQIGITRFADALRTSFALSRFRIRLFSAGEAPGHDSTELLANVADEFRRRGGGDRIDVSTARTALDKASEIARSGFWAGTSLHGFIIATAFAVPRVGLLLKKVEQYANSWDIPYPTGVSLRHLDRAVESAERIGSTGGGDDHRLADSLARHAESNIAEAVQVVVANHPEDRVASAELLEHEFRRLTPARRMIQMQQVAGRRVASKLGGSLRRRSI